MRDRTMYVLRSAASSPSPGATPNESGTTAGAREDKDKVLRMQIQQQQQYDTEKEKTEDARSGLSVARAGIGSIIEGRDNIKDFAALQLEEIELNIGSRRNRIFLLLEEVRRLRVQRRLKLNVTGGAETTLRSERAPTSIPFDSALPFLPQLSQSKLTEYYVLYACAVSAVILFGGLVAPILELRLGLGGTAYLDFIRSAHLPQQLAAVDPIVASFSGGAVGVLTTLLLIEVVFHLGLSQQEQQQ